MDAFSLIFNKPALSGFFAEESGGKVPAGIRIRFKDGTLQFRPSNTTKGTDIIPTSARERTGFQAIINGVRVERYMTKVETDDRPCFRLTKPAGNYGWIVATRVKEEGEDSPNAHQPLLRIWKKKLAGVSRFAGVVRRKPKTAAARSRPASVRAPAATPAPAAVAAAPNNDFVFALMTHIVQWFVAEHPEVLAKATAPRRPVRRAKPKTVEQEASPAVAATAPRRRAAAKKKDAPTVAAPASRRRKTAAITAPPPAPAAAPVTAFQRRKAKALATAGRAEPAKKAPSRRVRRAKVEAPVQEVAPAPEPEAQQPEVQQPEAGKPETAASPPGVSAFEEYRPDMSEDERSEVAARNASRMLGREPNENQGTVAALRDIAQETAHA